MSWDGLIGGAVDCAVDTGDWILYARYYDKNLSQSLENETRRKKNL